MSSDDTLDIERLFRRHLAERDFWHDLAGLLRRELERSLSHRRIFGKVEARAKTTGSVIGKAYRKPETYGDLESFTDLAAARALVPFISDVEPVVEEIAGHPHATIVKDEEIVREANEIDYQARHLDVLLDAEFMGDLVVPARDRPIVCELQIQTLSQNLWANVSHLVVYKREPSDVVRRRINRLVVLCELFDDEVQIARELALRELDQAEVISEDLHRYFLGITGVDIPSDSILPILARLLPSLDDDELGIYPSLLEGFLERYSRRIVGLLTDRPEAREIAWLLRPEVLFVFERISNRPALFSDVWDKAFQRTDREALAAAWGPVD